MNEIKEVETTRVLLNRGPLQRLASLRSGNWMLMTVLLMSTASVLVFYGRARAAATKASGSHDEPSADQIIAAYLNGRSASGAGLQSALQSTDILLQKSHNDGDQAQVPLEKLQGNPFGESAAVESAAHPKESNSDRVALLREIEKLQLQSIVHADTQATCMINNRLYSEGEQINGFTIESIGAASVVVCNGGFRFELKVDD